MSLPNNVFSSASNAYKQYRPQYPQALYQYLAEIAPANNIAWDCGCGNGQASVALARFFQRVCATDISAEQIAEAQAMPNVVYSVSPAETFSAEDNSVDLVTVAQAIHWFNHQQFFAEVDRVLKPGGVLACWGYQLMYTDTPLDDVIARLHSDIVGPYWPKGRELLEDGYAQIPFVYPRLQTPKFAMRCRWRLAQLLGYLDTWSAVKAYRNQYRQNPIEFIRDEITEAWGNEEQSKEVYWPLILYVGQKTV